jgi:uncharacterized protein (DUF433 family)
MRAAHHALSRETRPPFHQVLPSHPRIVRDEKVWGAKAVVAGTRIPVFQLLARLEAGWTEATLLEEYPTLEADDVRAAILYAKTFPARVMADRRAYERSLPPDVG